MWKRFRQLPSGSCRRSIFLCENSNSYRTLPLLQNHISGKSNCCFVPFFQGAVGFDRGLEPVAVMGAYMKDNERHYLIKWQGIPLMDLVPAYLVRARCPQLIITFCESIIIWGPLLEWFGEFFSVGWLCFERQIWVTKFDALLWTRALCRCRFLLNYFVCWNFWQLLIWYVENDGLFWEILLIYSRQAL